MSETLAAYFTRHDAGRVAALLPVRYHRMQTDAFAFFRGSAPLYYERFGADERLCASPTGWLCGDAHVENFGSYKGDNGLVYFDVNDFDEALRGPILWDVGRLIVSVLLAADHFGLPAAERHAAARETLATYAATLATGKAYLLERATATGVIRQLLKAVAHRSPRKLLVGRASRRNGWHLRDIPTLFALPAAEHAAVRAAFETWRSTQPLPPCGAVLDVAQRVVGVGSLGVPRYVVLAEHRHSRKLPILIDLKMAPPAAASRCAGVPQPAWPAEAARVSQCQTWLQAVPPAPLLAIELLGQSFVLRTLQPVADKLDFDLTHGQAAFRTALPDFARLLAWAHLRGSAHRGGAGPDALQEFGAGAAWQAGVLSFTTDAVTQVGQDYRAFRAACRTGALPTSAHPHPLVLA